MPLPPQVVARLEAVLSQKRFTQLGGLQLEKDVRLLVGESDLHALPPCLGLSLVQSPPTHLTRLCLLLPTYAGGLSDMTARTVRDKFARLSQMATLLTLESVREVLDYWGGEEAGAGAIAWRLTDADVRHTLSQRLDFAPHEILALKL